ncbi:MAG: RNA methyltransferase [Saprospiraceae bacterium]|nr:RNA methyltransferase [Saprospiraceae bacterium]
MRKLKTEELHRLSVDEFKSMTKMPLVVVLDNIRSGMNVGSVFRTGDAFGIEHIFLCGITATPPHREILKSAIGATESVSWTYMESVAECLQNLKEKGFQIVGIEQTSASDHIQNLTVGEQPVALVFGNEVEGLSESVLPLLDACYEIPQIGTKHSLNISVCAGIVLWKYFEKWGANDPSWTIRGIL